MNLEILKQSIPGVISQDTYYFVSLKGDKIFSILERLKNNLGFELLLDVIKESASSGVSQKLILFSFDTSKTIIVEIPFDEQLNSSIVTLWKNFDWFDLNRIPAIGPDGKTYLTAFDRNKYRNDGLEAISFRPGEYFGKEFFRHDLLLNHDIICDSKIEIGFETKGIEAAILKSKIDEISSILCKTGSDCANYHQLGWLILLERLLQIDIPLRAQVLRMILLEFTRIIESANMFIKLSRSISYFAMEEFARWLKIELASLLDQLEIDTREYFILGGTAIIIPPGWIANAFDVLTMLGNKVDQFESDFVKNRFFSEHTKNHSINKLAAIKYGLTGPNLRASGINYDLRKRSPLYLYSDLQFEVPIGLYGQSFDRSIVRLEEMRQSISIITQLLENIPHGEIVAEDLVHQDMMIEKLNSLSGSYHQIIETPNGLASIYAEFAKDEYLKNFSFAGPDLNHICAFQDLVIGESIRDASIIYSSYNINVCDADR